jgi:transposase
VAEALGRSCGGCSTQSPAWTDALGNPVDLGLPGGPAADRTQAAVLWPDEPVDAGVADQGYAAEACVAPVSARGAGVVMPPRKNRPPPREYDRQVSKERPLSEGCFGKITHYRRSFARCEKTARNYLGFLRFVAALVWLR